MDWIGPAVVAATVSGIVSTIGFWLNRSTTLATHIEKLTADRNLAERKFEFDKSLAESKFKYDCDLNDHKRRVELAEMVLSDFYQMTAVLKEIRNPGAYNSEWEDRKPSENESEGEVQTRNAFYVPLARIKRNSEFISGMMSRRYSSRAILGNEIDLAFQNVHEILVSIQVSAGTLMRMVGRDGDRRQGNEALWDRCEANIWMGYGETDELEEKMGRTVALAERVCQSVIGGGVAS